MTNYNHQEIEKKWREYWQKEKIYQPDLVKAERPFYNLMMFPYPSAEGLHVGNMYAFVHGDAYGRFKRLQGYDVFEPIGLDGFGIHSENYAIKIKEHIRDVSARTEKHFYEQLHQIGNGYDWSRTVETYKPNYYHWTQWLFLQMYKKGLAYRKKSLVNWCPSCKTVLSDEQVISEKCERCNSIVEKKEMEQWFWKITDYAERLLKNLDAIDWTEEVKTIQRNWIGKSEGAEINFSVIVRSEATKQSRVKSDGDGIAALPCQGGVARNDIKVFTTRPDTLFGATYMVVAPEHKLIKDYELLITNKAEVEEYVAAAKNKTEIDRTDISKEKTGVELKGIKAINPVNNEEIPVFVADYVLSGYGTGAIMAVPAHDERDFEFAQKYDLPIKNVVEPEFGEKRENEEFKKRIVALVYDPKSEKVLTLNWGDKFGGYLLIGGGVESGEDIITTAKREIREETGYTDLKFVAQSETCHHHYIAYNKGVNRGCDITGLYFELSGEERVGQNLTEQEKDHFMIEWLSAVDAENKIKDPLHNYLLKKFIKSTVFVGNGIAVDSELLDGLSTPEAKEKIIQWLEENKIGQKKIQYKLRDWCVSRQRYWGPPIPMVYCGKCDWQPVAENDLPVLLPDVDDFLPDGSGKGPLNKVKDFVQTKCPKCGGEAERETDVSDPFVDSCWYYLRYPCTEFDDRPFDQKRLDKWLPVDMYIGGKEHSVLHLLYSRFVTMVLHELGYAPTEEPFAKFRAHGLLIREGAKISKSKGNIINPDEYIEKYGADAVRLYLMFLGDMRLGGDWQDKGLNGVVRFLRKVWELQGKIKNEESRIKNENKKLNSLIHKTIKGVGEDLENLKYNTAISKLMILVNEMEKAEQLRITNYELLIVLLASFAPYMAEELWEKLGHKESVFKAEWPKYDLRMIKDEEISLVVQINGKVRENILVAADITEAEAKKIVLENETVKKWLDGKEPKKIIFVPGKLINIVI